MEGRRKEKKLTERDRHIALKRKSGSISKAFDSICGGGRTVKKKKEEMSVLMMGNREDGIG